ncbi:MAG: amidophosphoribosyltransferase [Planctomycetota bacterium]|nr:amidophosphoribosyltransferase [Planctomycetota bacterium]MDI6788116.1 amidophosphoribosyltransferase [Planctomycetota bacterium]
MCGILGICGSDSVVGEVYNGLNALQHRGQDSAGIITYDGQFHLKKGNGLVQNIFSVKNIERLGGNIGIGHVRYPTVGGGDAEDAQPFYINSPFGIAMAHNGNVTNHFELREELEKKGRYHINSSCDVEVILNVFADELLRVKSQEQMAETIFRAVVRLFKRVEGSYSVVGIIANKGLFAFRDPHGIKPLIFGRRGNDYCFASESVALDILGYQVERDVAPGEVIFIQQQTPFFKAQREIFSNSPSAIRNSQSHTPCIFEWIYFARPDSVLDGINVYEARLRLGEELAKEVSKRALKTDIVVPVPDSAKPAALALSSLLKLPYREALVKNRYIGRTFIMSSQEDRENTVKQKLNPIKSKIKDKRVLLVDDSIVRGTTSREIVNLVKNAGAKEVSLAITCPPLRYPCVYGIDMQTKKEFIARNKDEEKIAREIGVNKLVYQTLDGLIRAVSIRPFVFSSGRTAKNKYCTACFTGIYPTKISEKMFKEIERDRLKAQCSGVTTF